MKLVVKINGNLHSVMTDLHTAIDAIASAQCYHRLTILAALMLRLVNGNFTEPSLMDDIDCEDSLSRVLLSACDSIEDLPRIHALEMEPGEVRLVQRPPKDAS